MGEFKLNVCNDACAVSHSLHEDDGLKCCQLTSIDTILHFWNSSDMELLFSPSDFKHRAQMFIAKPRAEKDTRNSCMNFWHRNFPLVIIEYIDVLSQTCLLTLIDGAQGR